jgi:predicted glycosyltransferase involved in capsule biosynthesis
MISSRKRKENTVEVTKFVACLPGYEDFNYKPVNYIHSWFRKKSANDYKTEKEWKKQKLNTELNH